jgi:thiol-disulfide isomerase/thioredoxin
MLKKIILSCIYFLPFLVQAQSSFDSLKKIYHAQYVFEQREKGDSFKFIKEELNTIKNPELKQLAACAIASNVYGYGFVDNKKLLSLVENVLASPQSESARTIAVEVKAELIRTLVNTKIQSISLPSLNGDTLKLADFYTSKFDYVIVDLWATWCGPCVAEMRKFNALRKQYNIEFYSISIDRDMEKVQKFISKNGSYAWPIVWAGEGSSVQDYFKARLIPAFFIVNKEGIVVEHIVGKGLEEELNKLHKK